MGLAHTNRFRGSAAFFALLLAASGARPDSQAAPDTAPDLTPSDAKTATAGQPARALSTHPSVGQAIGPASKFSRRRPPIARPGLLPPDRQAAARHSLPA